MLNPQHQPQGFPKEDGVTVVRIPAGTAKPERSRFARTSTNAIMDTEFEAIRWIVPDYVPEGLSVLAGRQKLGKTWLAIDWALAVAVGGIAMGSIEVEAGNVLYVDMENGPRRIQRRINALYPDERSRPDLSRLEWMTDAPALDKGLLDALDDWRRSVPQPRLIVIDVLQRIKSVGLASRNSYENDYSIWSPLQRWATEQGIGIIGLHHTKKGGADDPLEALSGSNGLSACADTTLVLDRDGNGITLYVRGRDVDEKESALSFNSGTWSIQGDAAKLRTTSERLAILAVLESASEPMTPNDIAAAGQMKSNNVRFLLHKMVEADEVRREGRGKYVHPDKLSNTANNANNGEGTHVLRGSNVSEGSEVANNRNPIISKAGEAEDSDVSDVSGVYGGRDA